MPPKKKQYNQLSKSAKYYYDHEAIKEPCNPNTNLKISKSKIKEITEIRKYESDPPIWFVSLDGPTVEVDGAKLHDAEKFSVACMEQIGKPLMTVPLITASGTPLPLS